MGRTIAYCRVSSRDQNPQLQLDALHAHGDDQLFAEKESGKHGTARPEFTKALAALQPGDTLVFWKSDRWGRSAAHVLTTVGELRDRGVTVKSLTENFDLDTKEGRFMFAVLAAAAEYELELRAERQAEGIAAARRRQAAGTMLPGKKHIGRPRVTGPAELAALRQLIRDGTSVTQAARTPEDLPLHRLRRAQRPGVEPLIIGEAGVEPGSEVLDAGAGDPDLPHCCQARLSGQRDLAVGGRGPDPLVAERRRGEQPPGRAVAWGGAAEVACGLQERPHGGRHVEDGGGGGGRGGCQGGRD